MRTSAVLTLALLLALGTSALADPGVNHLAQVATSDLTKVASGTIPLAQTALTYKYNNQWGIAEIWQLQGTTLLYGKKVHTKPYADQMRAQLIGGGSLSGMQASVFDLEYGDYEQYSTGTLTAAEVKTLYQSLAGTRLPEAPANVGCGEKHWEVNLSINGKATQIFDVNAPANPILADSLTVLVNLLKAKEAGLTVITQSQFDAAYRELIPNPNLGS